MKYTLILFSAFVVLFSTSCKREIKPAFQTVENVYFKKEDGMITAYGDVIFHNPNSVSITVTASDLTLSLNQKEIGKANFEEAFVVEAKKDFTVPLVLTFKPDNILKNLFSTGGLGRMVKTKTADFIVDGTVSVKVIEKDFAIPVKSITEVDLRPKF